MDNMWGLTIRGICEVDEKILLLKLRSNSAHDKGKWEIPGGKIKKGEFFDEALKREYLEETGLNINIISLKKAIQNDYVACKTNEKIKSIQLIMNVTVDSMDVKISEEHDEYRWFSKNELKKLIEDDLLTPPAKLSFE